MLCKLGRRVGRTLFFLTGISAMLIGIDSAAASCLKISTPVQFSNIRNDLSQTYCLTNDIDLGSISNFLPFGDVDHFFGGKLLGNNHVIKNLKIRASNGLVGLFPRTYAATIQDVTFENATIVVSLLNGLNSVGGIAGWTQYSSFARVRFLGTVQCSPGCAGSDVGGIVGTLDHGGIDQSSTAGVIRCDNCVAGGIAGSAYGDVKRSWSASAVKITTGTAGGAAGRISRISTNVPNNFIQTFASGSVVCSGSCTAGGLVGDSYTSSLLHDVYSLTTVTVGAQSTAGGLVGKGPQYMQNTYATGNVTGGDNCTLGGLVGMGGSTSATSSYATGMVRGGPGSSAGGIFGGGFSGSGNVYWDTETSKINTDHTTGAPSTPVTTSDLRTDLLAGLNASAWSITKTLSFPYLNAGLPVLSNATFSFASPLATLVKDNRLYIFLPVRQLESFEYSRVPAHADQASLAAVYTMIARAIGKSINSATLMNTKIDAYWNDVTLTTKWGGAVQNYVALGAFHTIGTGTALNDSNVVGAMKMQRAVVLRGTYAKKGGGTATHWMLGSLFTTQSNGAPLRVVANDPYTGQQVQINLSTKRVVSPTAFPLSKFTVDGYQTVTLK